MAIFVVDWTWESQRAKVVVPHELLPLPAAGDTVQALDAAGNPVCLAEVASVQSGADRDGVALVSMLVPKQQALAVRSFRTNAV